MDVTFEPLQVVQQQTSVSVGLNQYPEGETTDLICVVKMGKLITFQALFSQSLNLYY